MTVSRRLLSDNKGLDSILVLLRSSCQNCLHHAEDFCHSISKATDWCASAQLLRGLAENAPSCPVVSLVSEGLYEQGTSSGEENDVFDKPRLDLLNILLPIQHQAEK